MVANIHHHANHKHCYIETNLDTLLSPTRSLLRVQRKLVPKNIERRMNDKDKPPTSIDEIDLDVLEGTLSFYIRSINIAVSRDLDERLDGLEVAKGTGKISTLLLVDSHPGIRSSFLAQLTLKDRSAMGRIVDQMVASGLVRRETSAEDSRVQELYITPQGADLAVEVRARVTKQSEDFFAGVPEAETKLLLDLLRRTYRRIAGLDRMRSERNT